MKAIVGAFKKQKALVGAFSVIVKPVVEPMDRFTALLQAATNTSTECVHNSGVQTQVRRRFKWRCQEAEGRFGPCWHHHLQGDQHHAQGVRAPLESRLRVQVRHLRGQVPGDLAEKIFLDRKIYLLFFSRLCPRSSRTSSSTR